MFTVLCSDQGESRMPWNSALTGVDHAPVHFLLDIWNSCLLTTEITEKNILGFSTITWWCIFWNLFHLATVNIPPLMLSAGIQVISFRCVIINTYSFSLLPCTSGPVDGFSLSRLPHNYMIYSLASLSLRLMCQRGLLHAFQLKSTVPSIAAPAPHASTPTPCVAARHAGICESTVCLSPEDKSFRALGFVPFVQCCILSFWVDDLTNDFPGQRTPQRSGAA